MLDEHVVAPCVAVRVPARSGQRAGRGPRARLRRASSEKDQEKLKRCWRGTGATCVMWLRLSARAARTRSRRWRGAGAGLHALRLCGAILAFCAVCARRGAADAARGFGGGAASANWRTAFPDLAAAVQ